MSWPLISLGEVVKITKGKKHNLADGLTLTRYIQIDDLRNDNLIKYTHDDKGTLAERSDVIIAWDGANAGTIGYGLKGLIGSTLARISIVSSEIYTEYLGRFLQSKFKEIRNNCTGATIPHVSKVHLISIKIPLPPLQVQKQIAAVLEKADTLRSQCQQIEQELNSLAQSVFLYNVGDKSNEFLNWPEHSIESLCSTEKGSMRTGPFGSDLKHSEFVKSGYPVIGIDNAVDNEFKWKERRFITEEKFQKLKRYTVKPKDIIITIMGTVGRVAVIPENIPTSISTKHLAVLTINDEIALPDFVADAFRYSTLVNRQIRKKNKGAIMDGLNLGLIKSLNLRLPPLQLQKEYLRRKNKLISSLLLCRSEGAELTDSFNSLMQKAFIGELDLKDVA